jgi:hypothetical protein
MILHVRQMALSLLVVAMCCVLLAACGGGGGPVAKTRAVAFASAVNLRGSDVPAMGPFVSGFETGTGPPFGSCTTHVGASDEVVAVESPWFLRSRGRRGGHVGLAVKPPIEGAHSVVYVVRNPGLATRNVSLAPSVGAPACVQRLSVSEASGRFVGREPYKRQIEASLLPFPLSGVGGYGLRVRGTVAGAVYHAKRRQVFYEDTFGFAVGPAEIVLYAVGIARPFPSAMERRVLLLLYERAKAHALS